MTLAYLTSEQYYDSELNKVIDINALQYSSNVKAKTSLNSS